MLVEDWKLIFQTTAKWQSLCLYTLEDNLFVSRVVPHSLAHVWIISELQWNMSTYLGVQLRLHMATNQL